MEKAKIGETTHGKDRGLIREEIELNLSCGQTQR